MDEHPTIKNLPFRSHLLSEDERMEITNTSYTLLSLNGNLSNLSSQNQLCTGSYNPALAVFDILMVIINLPITIHVIVELLLKQCAARLNPGNSSSFSMSEIFFFHLCCIHFFYYIGILLIIIRNLGGVTGIRREYITALHSSSLIGGSFCFAVMSIDLYLAVIYPIKYVGLKTSTKQNVAHICCTIIWAYVITQGILVVIFDMSMYHPLPVISFYVVTPVSIFCCMIVLISLRTVRPGKSSQSSTTDKTKENAVRFIKNSMIILAFYNLPHCCLVIYATVKKAEWESLPCNALPLLLLIQISEFVAPLIFFYNTGRLKAVAIHCATVFQCGISLC